ncbi:hypothetical protein AUR64_11875 [Haloprofundus marisrubri]|uniref:Pyrrolo-quinoline quinone repeat domain-containing protein n=1 Tax=Haloprofundus marisrubri TaxID=1514971 RepID=A0A0W1RAY3_9EURY|nr:PQQ-binding-like beta-propeller repeat protein [Haloprofundus marisrubri]KTG10271.1 hypothetical protein AUR64_11875 [Haloprofundus marisrubri]
MRRRTVAALAVLSVALLAVAGVALTTGGPELRERWVSDTARDTLANHHAVGTDGSVVVAPVNVPERDGVPIGECALVSLGDGGETRWRYVVPESVCTPHALTEPAVSDLTDDGRPEIAVVTTERELLVLDADGAVHTRLPMDNYGYGAPTVGDIDGDGTEELVASDIGGGAVAVEVDGNSSEVLWRTDLGASTFPTPVVGDIDGDGANETLFGTSDGPVLLGANGTVEWRGDGAGIASMVVDGASTERPADVFVGRNGEVAAFDGRNGSERWSATFEANPRVGAVGDIDGDRVVYATLTDGRVVALDAESGDVRWTVRISTGDAAQHPAPKLGDLDGDGTEELVVLTNDGTVSVLDPVSGETRTTYERDVPVWVYPTIADTDGDGSAEILVRYGDGRVVSLAYDSGS